MGAASITGFDCDQDALGVASNNMTLLDVTNIDLVMCDIQSLNLMNGWFVVLQSNCINFSIPKNRCC